MDDMSSYSGELQRKQNTLRNFLALLSIGIGTIYLILDIINHIEGGLFLYLPLLAGGITSYFLNARKQPLASSVILLMTLNMVIAITVETDKQHVSSHVFFIPLIISTFGILGIQQKYLAFSISLVSVLLYASTIIYDFDFAPVRTIKAEELKFYEFFNFGVALIATVTIIYFILQVNHHAENRLFWQATEIKNSQLQLEKKNKELLHINSELDHFVYSVSHDLRAPLSSVLGLTEIYGLSKSVEEKDRIVSLIQTRAKRLDTFIVDVLNFSKNDRLEVRPLAVNLEDMVRDIVNGLGYLPDAHLIKVDINLPKEVIHVDADRMRVIFNNLLSNAFKYVDRRKESNFVSIYGNVNDSTLDLKIEDNGIGIEPEQTDTIFEMFVRATDQSEGSGLGLYIVKEVVGKLGGSVSVRSAPREGTSFNVQIPIQA